MKKLLILCLSLLIMTSSVQTKGNAPKQTTRNEDPNKYMQERGAEIEGNGISGQKSLIARGKKDKSKKPPLPPPPPQKPRSKMCTLETLEKRDVREEVAEVLVREMQKVFDELRADTQQIREESNAGKRDIKAGISELQVEVQREREESKRQTTEIEVLVDETNRLEAERPLIAELAQECDQLIERQEARQEATAKLLKRTREELAAEQVDHAQKQKDRELARTQHKKRMQVLEKKEKESDAEFDRNIQALRDRHEKSMQALDGGFDGKIKISDAKVEEETGNIEKLLVESTSGQAAEQPKWQIGKQICTFFYLVWTRIEEELAADQPKWKIGVGVVVAIGVYTFINPVWAYCSSCALFKPVSALFNQVWVQMKAGLTQHERNLLESPPKGEGDSVAFLPEWQSVQGIMKIGVVGVVGALINLVWAQSASKAAQYKKGLMESLSKWQSVQGIMKIIAIIGGVVAFSYKGWAFIKPAVGTKPTKAH